MRQGNNPRRGRGRSGRRPNVPSRSHNYESNGPEGRVRGNASQVYEKYLQLARDTQSAGDRVLAESFMQHAEHYYRILNESTDPNNRPHQQRDARNEERVDERDGREREGEEERFNGHSSEQRALAPSRSVSRFGDRRQDVRTGDPRNTDARSSEGAAPEADSSTPAEPVTTASSTPAVAPEPAEAAEEPTAQAAEDKVEPEEAKPARRTRRSPTRRTTKSKTEEAAGGEEDAGLLKMLGESPRTNGKEPAQTPAPETAEAVSAGSAEGEAEAKPVKPRRRRTTKASSEAVANVDA